MPYTRAPNERGIAYGKDAMTVQIPKDSATFAPVIPYLENFIIKVTEMEQVMKPEAIPAQASRIAAPLYGAVRKALDSALHNAREVEALKLRSLIPPPAVAEAAKTFGSEVRANFRSMNEADKAKFLQNPTALQLACVLEQDGALSGASPQILELAREQALSVFHTERSALAASFPKSPSLERMVATGTAETDTQAAAAIAVANFKARVQAVEEDESVLQHLVGFLAVATSTTPAEALANVIGAKDGATD